ncbi:MAG: HAMP domain-containing sensor histidine kinase [Gammaproteobacteria bacterium]|jgi:signal transduction histidine kinase
MQLPSLFRTGVFHLTLVYMALFGASVATLSAFFYWSTIGSIERQSDSVIEAELQGLAEQYQRRGVPGLVEIIQERARRDIDGRSVYLFVTPDLRPLAGNLPVWPAELNRRTGWVNFVRIESDDVEIPARARIQQVGQGYMLMVGRANDELALLEQNFRRALIWGIGLTTGLALVGGLLMSLQAQRRVADINRTTRQIIAGDLSRRIPSTGANDEYEELARNLNAMLDQIEKLLSGLRHVGDSIAHDLRGPLTRLGNQLELLAAEKQPSQEGLAMCAEQAERLLATFNALLRIARVESGAYRSAFANLDLSQIISDICELYHAAAEEHSIQFTNHIAPGVRVFGDRELLAQAVTNLLDNAIKYSPDGGRISVSLTAEERRAFITVADNGPGIPASERERVFERFARLDQARSKPGNGLGLALVRAVAEQHGGNLVLSDNIPGLVVRLGLPLSALS